MERTEASLAALLAGLVAAPEPDAVARWIATGILQPWRCSMVLLHVVDRGELRMLGSHGLTPTQARRLRHIDPATALPPADVLRTGVAHGCAGAHLAEEHPLMAGVALPASGHYEFRAIRHDTATIGVMSVRIEDQADAVFHQAFGGGTDAVALWMHTLAIPTTTSVHAAPLRLTERQQRILAGLRRGRTNAAIAAELGFAVGTIKADIAAMSTMLGAHGRADVVERAARAGY